MTAVVAFTRLPPVRCCRRDEAIHHILKQHPEIGLFANDHHHPSPAGTYLAACAFYTVTYGRSPEGLPSTVKDLKAADTGVLQKQAFVAVEGGSVSKPAAVP